MNAPKMLSRRYIRVMLRVATIFGFVLSACSPLLRTGKVQTSGEEQAAEEGVAVELEEFDFAEGEEGISIDEIDLSDEGSLESEGLDVSVEGEILNCPDEKHLYILKYSHLLTMEGPGFSFRSENQEVDPYFQIYIYPDGRISSDGLFNTITLKLSGYAEDCELYGTAALTAQISGTCQGSEAKIKIVEQHENYSLRGSCPEAERQLVELLTVSAPEDTHTFKLHTGGDDYVLSYDAGLSSAIYSWTLFPASGLGMVPLVPQDE